LSNKTILSFETSSLICGVAIIKNDKVISDVEVLAERRHAELLPELTEQCFKNMNYTIDDIDAIALSIGPGSFTGLRVGLGFGKGLAFSKNYPIIPVPTMLSLAYNLEKSKPEEGIMLSHAKKVFYQQFIWEGNTPKITKKPSVVDIDDYIPKTTFGFQYNCEKIIKNGLSLIESKPSAGSIGLLGSIYYNELIILEPYDLTPEYIAPFQIGDKK
tara:strand:+ start:220 stop:864 length:645 start_codon:yes stop_codon:yes gene_type:complete